MVLIPFLSILGIIYDFVLVRKSLKTKKNKKIGLEALSRVSEGEGESEAERMRSQRGYDPHAYPHDLTLTHPRQSL